MQLRRTFLAVSALALACEREPTPAEPPPAQEVAAPTSAAAALRERALPILPPLPKDAASEANPGTEAKVALGKSLYYDPRLSRTGDMSCNTCHPLERYGAEPTAVSTGVRGEEGERNAPTVYNAALHVAQFWDGRAPDVEQQAKGPITNPIEMDMADAAHVERVLRSIPDYGPAFRAAFPAEPEPVTFENTARAIAAFERTLVSPSRFDAFLAGRDDALTSQEQRGLATFLDVGCVSCHHGSTVGGLAFQKLGAVRPFPTQDPGREAVTHQPSDRGVFKVPSLRNVAETGPYFHDGSIPRVDDAVRTMADVQLGRALTEEQVQDLDAFLGSLTGAIDASAIAPPPLPPDGPETPRPAG